ncbi:MAG: universal stress protein [Thalassovita sp.]
MYDNILVPISFDENRDARGALEIAQAICAKEGKISLLHVMEEVPGYAVSYIPEGFHAGAKDGIEADLKEMGKDISNVEISVVDGHSGRTILEYAQKHAVDCIVVASHRPGMQDLLLGSTATQVVRHAKCAVHVLR